MPALVKKFLRDISISFSITTVFATASVNNERHAGECLDLRRAQRAEIGRVAVARSEYLASIRRRQIDLQGSIRYDHTRFIDSPDGAEHELLSPSVVRKFKMVE